MCVKNNSEKKIGINFYDEITKIEINSLNRPAKEYIYLFGFILLLLTFISQKSRNNKNL